MCGWTPRGSRYGRTGGRVSGGDRRGVRGNGRSWALTWARPRCEFWLEFLRRLVARRLRGVRLVNSDAHQGLKQAIGEGLSGRDVAAGSTHVRPVERGCASTPSLS